MQNNIQIKNRKEKKYNKLVAGLTIATSILSATTLGFGIAYGVAQYKACDNAVQLENVYKKNYYELVDNVNALDTKLSKMLISDSSNYKLKMLSEVSQGAKELQGNIASLPLSGENIVDTVRFINQMSGYTQILEEKLSKGGTLTEDDMNTISEIHNYVGQIKIYLNKLTEKMMSGYSIMEASSKIDGDFNLFSSDFGQVKSADIDYPTMIYDGPFSDSVINQKVVGLSGKIYSEKDSFEKIKKIFKNVSVIDYKGQTKGKFDTYNFALKNLDDQILYVQVTKVGGNILSISGNVLSNTKSLSLNQAENIALNFARENGIKDVEVVWKEELDSQIYFNIAPKVDGVIVYPELVKVKIDLEKGNVVGYDAMTYWTNHKDRSFVFSDKNVDSIKAKIDSTFIMKNNRVVLIPLDYNREVLCYEFECERNGEVYYLYFNVIDGKEENILKIIKTDDGSKLM